MQTTPNPDAVAQTYGRIVIIGFGSMGSAVFDGVMGIPGISAADVAVCDHKVADGWRGETLGCAGYTSVSEALEKHGCDVAILCVRPGDAAGVAAELADYAPETRPVLISIMSGVSNARLAELFGSAFDVVRVMPNTPLAVGCGMTLVSEDAPAGERGVELARSIFDCTGSAVVIPESLFDIGMALSGCGPAYFELIADALARAGVRHGLSRAVSDQLVQHTMLGTAKLLIDTQVHPQRAIDAVCTPGGTTIAGVETMEAEGLRTALAYGVTAAVERAKGQS